MSCDIYGWVEINNGKYEKVSRRKHSKKIDGWDGIINIKGLWLHNYEMFGSLFGVRNRGGFEPIANWRGLPEIISREVLEDPTNLSCHAHSWIIWEEIKNINWEETGKKWRGVDRYLQDENNELVLIDEFLDEFSLNFEDAKVFSEYDWEKLKNGLWVEKDNILYKLEKQNRGKFLGGDWQLLFDLMERLSIEWGEKNVRLVVWFDMP